jgi:hypothetical protein
VLPVDASNSSRLSAFAGRHQSRLRRRRALTVGAVLVCESGEVTESWERDLRSFDISGEEHAPEGIGQFLNESPTRRIVHRKVPSLFALAAVLRRRFRFVERCRCSARGGT